MSLSHRVPHLALLGLLLSGLSPHLAQAQIEAESLTTTSGNVSAEFVAEASDFCVENPQLTITRAGKTYSDGFFPPQLLEDGWFCRAFELAASDLDGDAEPEVRLEIYSGGAHCCSSTLIYDYEATSDRYRLVEHFWGNGGYQLQDLDGDGIPEFLSHDDSFAYAFASYAASRYPVQFWRYRAGVMEEVTRDFPDRVYNDAYAHWQELQRLRQGEIFEQPYSNEDDYIYAEYEKAILAAYLADKYLLDQAEDGWQRVRQAYQRSDRDEFFSDLRDFLRRTGYARESFTQRLEFAPEADSTYISGALATGKEHGYLVNLPAQRSLSIEILAGAVEINWVSPGGNVIETMTGEAATWTGELPTPGDYLLEVRPLRETRYSILLSVE
ncbi:hypothetical protein [Almyronema epifaneia]|uniref:Uncharacterized protein n=1 Tax=Almyronema epifaneia S1 TaxID=2991925 RepID=A0ABW6ICR3_9CYAN